MKELKRSIAKNEKNEKNVIFGRNLKASYFKTETLMVRKVAYVLASLCEGEWFSYLFSSEKNQLQVGKSEKIQNLFYCFICSKKSRAKTIST